MVRLAYLFCLMSMVMCLQGCKESYSHADVKKIVSKASYFHDGLDDLTSVIVHDIFSPPVASRVYVYPCIAAYEVLASAQKDMISLAGRVDGLKQIQPPTDTMHLSYEVAALTAFYKVGTALIFSEQKLEAQAQHYFDELDSLGVPASVLSASRKYGELVASQILSWADKDNYKESRSFSKYSISDDPARWKPTPPAYMEGIEPHWNKMRTLVLASSDQFRCAPPPKYSMKQGSEFRTKTEEVYEVGISLTEEQKAIASFWDCNPFVMNQTGHIMFGTKKITPGGHWMGIANVASETARHDLAHSIHTATLVSIALYDAFIACWDEKYRSVLVRPETVIQEHLDEDWAPLLQTPPFPEHTSGHSVISTAAATVLTALLGDGFRYVDDVELKYGLSLIHI